MLCTKCNSSVKPVIALDIDGTLADWHRHWFNFADGYFNRPFSRRFRGDCLLHEHMGITLEQYRQAKLCFRQGGWKRTMPIYHDVDVLVDAVRALGAELWITTTRPYLRLDNTDPDTREWLDRHDIFYDGLLYDEDKYGKLLEVVGPNRVIGVLEDEPECYDRAYGLGLHPILIDRTHNELDQRSVAAPSLEAARKMLVHRLFAWKEAHAERYPV